MEALNRTRNTLRNSMWGWISKIISMIFPFIVRTCIIYVLGEQYLGLNSVFSSVLSVLSLSELGVGAAIVYSMYKPVADGDTAKINALLALYKNIYRIIGFIVLTIGLGIIPFLPKLVHDQLPENINLYILYCLYLTEAVVSYWLFAYLTSLLQAYQRNDVLSKVQIVLGIIKYLAQILVLILFKNYYFFVLALPAYNIIYNIINAVIVKMKYPQYGAGGRLSREELMAIKERVLGLLTQKICATTRNSLDSIVLSTMFGLTTVAIYNNYYFIMFTVSTFFGVFQQSIVAGVGNSIVTETMEKNYKDFNKFQFIYMWISGLCAALLLCLYQPFMLMWLNNSSMLMTTTEVVCWSLYFYLLKQGDMISVYNSGAGLWWHGKSRYILETICNLVLNIVLGKLLGSLGVILATIISIICFSSIYGAFIVFKYYFGENRLKRFYVLNTIYFLLMAAAASAAFALCSCIPVLSISLEGILYFCLRIIICVLCFTTIYFLAVRRLEEYKDAKGYVLNILRHVTHWK